jgi:hypothetical protein
MAGERSHSNAPACVSVEIPDGSPDAEIQRVIRNVIAAAAPPNNKKRPPAARQNTAPARPSAAAAMPD